MSREMHRFLWALLAWAGASFSQVLTFAWDHDCPDSSCTYELHVNGNEVDQITGFTAEIGLPGIETTGGVVYAQVRAIHPTLGVSDWASIAQTFPADPRDGRVIYHRETDQPQ